MPGLWRHRAHRGLERKGGDSKSRRKRNSQEYENNKERALRNKGKIILKMKLEIIEDKENEFLHRKEIKAILEYEKNPSLQEAAKIIAEKMKVNEENIAIKLIKGKFGHNTFFFFTEF